MKNKLLYVVVYSVSVVAGFILFFAGKTKHSK